MRTRRAIMADRRKHAKYRPAKRFRKGLGGHGDWARKHYRSQRVKKTRRKSRGSVFWGTRGLGRFM